MLTINLIFNTLAMLAGAALHSFDAPKGAPDAKALVLKLKKDANVVVTGPARKAAHLASQIGFQKATAELQTAARAGVLAEHQYKLWQGRGELLLIELDIPSSASCSGSDRAFGDEGDARGDGQDPSPSFSARSSWRCRSSASSGSAKMSWTYDPTHPPEAKRLEALKARFGPQSREDRTLSCRRRLGSGRLRRRHAHPGVAGRAADRRPAGAAVADMVAGGHAQSAADSSMRSLPRQSWAA